MVNWALGFKARPGCNCLEEWLACVETAARVELAGQSIRLVGKEEYARTLVMRGSRRQVRWACLDETLEYEQSPLIFALRRKYVSTMTGNLCRGIDLRT